MLVIFKKEKLVKAIELLRDNEGLDIDSVLKLIEEEAEDKVEDAENELGDGVRIKRLEKERNYSRGSYTHNQKVQFENVMRKYKKTAYVPGEVVKKLSKELNRSEVAIESQLYEASKRLNKMRREGISI